LPGTQIIVPPTQVTTSDSAGRFALAAVSPGQHAIYVSALGFYRMVFPSVEFAPGDTVRLEFQLVRRPLQHTECMVAPECQQSR
jgi:hypothetical protein